jgi:hypothetical protein
MTLGSAPSNAPLRINEVGGQGDIALVGTTGTLTTAWTTLATINTLPAGDYLMLATVGFVTATAEVTLQLRLLVAGVEVAIGGHSVNSKAAGSQHPDHGFIHHEALGVAASASLQLQARNFSVTSGNVDGGTFVVIPT